MRDWWASHPVARATMVAALLTLLYVVLWRATL